MMMETAFYASIAPHMKKPPKLKDLLLPDDVVAPRRRQSWQEMKAALMVAIPPKT